MHPYERYRLRQLVTNAVRRGLKPSNPAETGGCLLSWSRANAGLLGWSERLIGTLAPRLEEMAECEFRIRRPLPPVDLPEMPRASEPRSLSPTERRIRMLGSFFRMPAPELALFSLFYRAMEEGPIGEFLRCYSEDCEPAVEFDFSCAAALGGFDRGARPPMLPPRFQRSESGLMVRTHSRIFRLSAAGRRVVLARADDPAALGAAAFGASPVEPLPWDAFGHIRQGEQAARLLAEASRRKETGINILLHGAPGHGKTAFARALIRRAGLACAAIGEANADGQEPGRDDRIAAFNLGQQINRVAGGFVLLVDEADDILGSLEPGTSRERDESRVYLHRMIESASGPAIWITNHPARLSDAVLRRMTLSIHVESPPRPVRLGITRDVLCRFGVDLPAPHLERIAASEVPIALVENAARVAQLSGGAMDVIAMSIEEGCRLLGLPCPRLQGAEIEVAGGFDPSHSRADQDLVSIAERAAASGPQPVSFCLTGPPGTGKSAYARHLAEKFGLEPLVRRMSDLLGPFVGQTEQNIARAFRTAERRRCFLIVDEADSLLRTRARAERSWEASMVNEALTWMEYHPLPFAFTTNAGGDMDPASLRRFTYKINFHPMGIEQARALFRVRFGCEAPAALDRLAGLTPGDFATVCRRRRFIGGDPVALVAMLQEELAARAEGQPGKIGFV